MQDICKEELDELELELEGKRVADRVSCFARIDRTHCNALNEKDCLNCPFYKKREEIKNNPFYGYSYKDPKKHAEDMCKYKINPEDVIY